MDWYIITFIASVGAIFVLAIMSWVFGDFDIDLDGDADIDGDGSSILSFKGIIHFVLGFSGVLCVFAYVCDTHTFTWWQYSVATVGGIAMMYTLYRLYRFVMRAEHNSNDNNIQDGCDVVVLNHVTDDVYVVMVYTPSGTRKIVARYLESGEPVIGVREYRIRNEVEENGHNYRGFYKK